MTCPQSYGYPRLEGSPVAVAKEFPQRLSGADLRGEYLVEPQLQRKEIEATTFDRATLIRPRFGGSRLRQVSFVDAQLPSADFRRVEFVQVDFSGASLLGADFSEAVGLESITWSPTTVCPDGKSPKEATGCRDHLIRYPWAGFDSPKARGH